MTKQKSTKRALLLSALSLLMCVSMLIGSTFAWFTDSVTSGNNKIVAGNLDVELYHSDKTATDEKVSDTTKLFDDVTLWEPGAMVWEKLTVKNLGSLALKYTLNVNISDVSVVNGKSLADVLKVAVLNAEPTREDIVAAATEDLATFSLASDTELEAKTGEDTFYVAIYWAPSASDNDYNVPGEQLYADLGVTLVATQATVESDSFDDQYDEDATYPKLIPTVKSYEELAAAMEKGGEIALGADVTIPATAHNNNWAAPTVSSWAPVFVVEEDTVIDLNGFDINIGNYTGNGVPTIFRVIGANLTVRGEGDIVMARGTWISGHSNAVVNIEGGNWVSTNGGNDAIMMYHYSNLNISGGTFKTANYQTVNYQWDHHDYQAKITGGSFANWNPSNTADYLDINNKNLGKTMLADEYTVETEVVDGVTWYNVVAE